MKTQLVFLLLYICDLHLPVFNIEILVEHHWPTLVDIIGNGLLSVIPLPIHDLYISDTSKAPKLSVDGSWRFRKVFCRI